MKQLSWVAAGIACVLVAGAWIRAADRIHEDRREAIEGALRTGSALATAYEESVTSRLDTLRATGKDEEISRMIAGATGATLRAGDGYVIAVVAEDARGNLRQHGYLYSFRALARYPLVVGAGLPESTVLAAAERRRGDHYLVALLESIPAALACVILARFTLRPASMAASGVT